MKYVKDKDDLYFSLLKQWSNIETLLCKSNENTDLKRLPLSLNYLLPKQLDKDSVSRMMAFDTLNYLPNDILTKVDRASMSVGLETRAPLLDHNILEFAWRIPLDFKIRKEKNKITSKWIIRKILNKYIPSELIDRPKAGFGVPIGSWLRGPLKAWAEDEISYELIERQSFLNPKIIHKLWSEHQSGNFDHSNKLWPILMWQSWLNNNS